MKMAHRQGKRSSITDKLPKHISCVSFNPNFDGRTNEVSLKGTARITIINKDNGRNGASSSLAAVVVGNTDVKSTDDGHIKIVQGREGNMGESQTPQLHKDLRQVLPTIPDDKFMEFMEKLTDLGIYAPADFNELSEEDDILEGLLPRIQQKKFTKYVESIQNNIEESKLVVAQANDDLHPRVDYH